LVVGVCEVFSGLLMEPIWSVFSPTTIRACESSPSWLYFDFLLELKIDYQICEVVCLYCK